MYDCAVSTALAFVVGLVLGMGVPHARAHDSWISRGQFTNSVGAWCCGDNDCHVENATHIKSGWKLATGEVVPDKETKPSPDGNVVVCRVPNHANPNKPAFGAIAGKDVRCVFVPPEGF